MSIFLTHYGNKVYPNNSFAAEVLVRTKAQLLEEVQGLKSRVEVLQSNLSPIIDKDSYSYSLNGEFRDIILCLEQVENKVNYAFSEMEDTVQEAREAEMIVSAKK